MHEDKRSFKCIVYVLISRVCNRPPSDLSSSFFQIQIPDLVASRKFFKRSLIEQIQCCIGALFGLVLNVPDPELHRIRTSNYFLLIGEVLFFYDKVVGCHRHCRSRESVISLHDVDSLKNFKSYGQIYPAELSSVHNKFFKNRRHYEHSEPVVSNSSGCIEINMRLSFQLSEITRLPSERFGSDPKTNIVDRTRGL